MHKISLSKPKACTESTIIVFSVLRTMFENYSKSLLLYKIVVEVAWLRPISFRCLYVWLGQFLTKIGLLDKNTHFKTLRFRWDFFWGRFATLCFSFKANCELRDKKRKGFFKDRRGILSICYHCSGFLIMWNMRWIQMRIFRYSTNVTLLLQKAKIKNLLENRLGDREILHHNFTIHKF